MGTPLTEDEFAQQLADYRRSAFRLELQPAYNEPSEHATVAKFLAGAPEPPTNLPEFRAWFALVGELTTAGKTMHRVRVHENPPTDYQKWERWIDPWNTAAGERIEYLTRQQAHDIGLLPAAGSLDWWLLDDNRLIIMHFDAEHRRILNDLVTDPGQVRQACEWRDLAVRHARPREREAGDAPAQGEPAK